MMSSDVRPGCEDEAIATDEPTSDALQEAPSPGDVTLLMVDHSGSPPGYSGYPTVLPEPSPEEAYTLAVTGQG